jgi:hypothetical protein
VLRCAVLCGLVLFGVALSAQAMQCEFAWEAPTKNTDGTPLTDLAGYKLYKIAQPGALPSGVPVRVIPLATLANPSQPAVLVPCDERAWYVATAYDTWTQANESGPSNAVQVADITGPEPPVNLVLLQQLLEQALDLLRRR